MQNIYTEYLLKNGWKQLNDMTFQKVKNSQYEIFFDTTNQIELYLDSKRKSEKYLQREQDLISFLESNNLV